MVTLRNRSDAVNHYQNTEKKWENDLKSLKNQNNMLLSMANKKLAHIVISRRSRQNITGSAVTIVSIALSMNLILIPTALVTAS